MSDTNMGKPRLFRYDLALLFLWCWVLGFGYAFAIGHPDPIVGFGAGVLLFLAGLVALAIGWRSANRYRNAVLVSTGVFALAMFGVWGAINP